MSAPIQWTVYASGFGYEGYTPATYCQQFQSVPLDSVFYGYPTVFSCRYPEGWASQYTTADAQCPEGLIPDFTLQRCVTEAAANPAESFADGMALGWAVALAMCAAWAIMVMKRGI